MKLRSYTGDEIKVIGEKTVTEKRDKQDEIHKLKLLVVENEGPALLGRTWLPALTFNVITIKATPASLQQLLEENDELFNSEPGNLKNVNTHFEIDDTVAPVFCKA